MTFPIEEVFGSLEFQHKISDQGTYRCFTYRYIYIYKKTGGAVRTPRASAAAAEPSRRDWLGRKRGRQEVRGARLRKGERISSRCQSFA